MHDVKLTARTETCRIANEYFFIYKPCSVFKYRLFDSWIYRMP